MQLTHTLNLATVGFDPIIYIDTQEFDLASLEFHMIEGATFDSGVITIRKTNTMGGSPVDFSTPKTVAAAGLTELTTTDWQKARYLTIQVTTASTGAARVMMTTTLKYTIRGK